MVHPIVMETQGLGLWGRQGVWQLFRACSRCSPLKGSSSFLMHVSRLHIELRPTRRWSNTIFYTCNNIGGIFLSSRIRSSPSTSYCLSVISPLHFMHAKLFKKKINTTMLDFFATEYYWCVLIAYILHTGWTAYLLGKGFRHDAAEDDRGHHLSILHVPGRPGIHHQAAANVHLAHDKRLTC